MQFISQEKKTVIGKLQPLEIENIEINIVSWTKENYKTAISSVELPNMQPESSFQLEQNGSKQLMLLQDAQIPQAKDELSSVLERDYNTIYQNIHRCRKNQSFSNGYSNSRPLP